MRHLQTLRGRMLGASLLLAILVGTAFVALILSIRDARTAAEDTRRSEEVASEANELERHLLDLETGQRAYVITGQRPFLEPWEAGLREYPQSVARLRSLVRDPGQRARVDGIERQMNEYVSRWSQLVIDTVAVDRDEAARLVGTGEGRRRVDELRVRFDEFLERQRELTALRRERAEASGDRAVILGLGGLAGSLLLVLLFALYLVRSTIVPVEDVAAAARRLREGSRDARATERRGADEAATLTRDFNAMADELERSYGEVARQRAELSAVLEAANEGVAMASADGELVFTNARMDSFWRELGVAGGGSVWSRLAGLAQLTGTPERYLPAFAALAGDPEAMLEEGFEVSSLGRYFHGFTGPVRGRDGLVIGRVFVLRETTEERAAARAKEQFLATVSHELRTPLTSILGFTELVRRGEAGELTRQQDRFLSIVDRSARQLHALVDDLLTVGRTDEGRLDLSLEEVDLAAIAGETVDAAAMAAQEKKLELSLAGDDAVPVTGDRNRLAQLVRNLVGNAIKFTPAHGRIDVAVRREERRAVLEVTDSGIGISEADREQLFERFFRAAATAALVPGTGLGLAICKEIVDAHGGTIAVTSAEGVGTTFRVELPDEPRP